MDQQYTIDVNKVMHDLIDGEVVIVNLENGYYYSMDGIGAQVWELVVAGHGKDAIISAFEQRHEVPVTDDLTALFARLERENLIAAATESVAPNAVEQATLDYKAPNLQKFTDMESLLLLDPIHEVDETGWPHTN